MIILGKIFDFLKSAFSSENIKYSLSVILFLIILLNINTCNRLNKEKELRESDNIIHNNNIIAMNDSLKTYYDKKTNRLVTEKTAYLVKNIDDLEKYNSSLYNELNKVKGILAGITSSVNINIPSQTSNGNVTQDKDDTTKYTLPWSFKYSDNGLEQRLSGRSLFTFDRGKIKNPAYSVVDTNYMNIKIKYNFIEQGEKYIVQANSPSPLIKFTELDGVLILNKYNKLTPPKKSKWSFGPTIGFGLNTNVSFGNPRFGWNMGISGGYNF